MWCELWFFLMYCSVSSLILDGSIIYQLWEDKQTHNMSGRNPPEDHLLMWGRRESKYSRQEKVTVTHTPSKDRNTIMRRDLDFSVGRLVEWCGSVRGERRILASSVSRGVICGDGGSEAIYTFYLLTPACKTIRGKSCSPSFRCPRGNASNFCIFFFILLARPSMSFLIMFPVWARPRLQAQTRCNLFNPPLSWADKAWPPNTRLRLT